MGVKHPALKVRRIQLPASRNFCFCSASPRARKSLWDYFALLTVLGLAARRAFFSGAVGARGAVSCP